MKFSEFLRGAADRAPVDQVQVSTDVIVSRVKRRRALRSGANVAAGTGVVAVIAVAALGPLSGGNEDMGMADVADTVAEMDTRDDWAGTMDGQSSEGPTEEQPQGVTGAIQEDSAEGSAAGPNIAQDHTQGESLWACGTDFDAAGGLWTWGDTSGVTFSVEPPVAQGTDLLLPHALEAHRTVELISFAEYVITWDGMVVGHMINPETLAYGPDTGTFLPDLPEGQLYERLELGTDFDSLESWTILHPVNCWDGAALPAGDYDIHQAWTLAYAGEDAGPATENGEAEDEPKVTSEMPMLLEPFRVAADPVPLIVEGEPVSNPFEEYLDQ